MRRISSTLTRVSTLLMTVGLPNTPDCTGNGGLFRGSPRKPSIELKIAVSSPQMYAPPPRRISMSKANPWPRMLLPSRPARPRGVDGVLQPLGGQRVFAAEVDEALLAARREGGDRHGLDQAEGIALHDHPVLERAGLGLVRVADQVVGPDRLAGDRLPLPAGGERRAAPAHELGVGHLADDALGAQLDRPAQRLVPAVGAVVVEARRVRRRPPVGAAEATGRPPAAAADAAARRRRQIPRRASVRPTGRVRVPNEPLHRLSPATVTSAAGAWSQRPRHGLRSQPDGAVVRIRRGRRAGRGRPGRPCARARRTAASAPLHRQAMSSQTWSTPPGRGTVERRA